MRSLLAARSSRLVLAAAAVAALTATTTACGPGDSNAGGAADPTGDAPASSSPKDASADAGSSGKGGSDSKGGTAKPDAKSDANPGSVSGGSAEEPVDADGAKKDYYGQACGTNDLTFTVSEKTQGGGYFLVTAKAKSGITCQLDGNIPNAAFGSAADTHASNAEQAVTDGIKLSGSTAAYAGINPKSTNTDSGKEFGQLIIAITGFEDDAVSLKISDTVVDKPVATNWHANPADAVPLTS